MQLLGAAVSFIARRATSKALRYCDHVTGALKNTTNGGHIAREQSSRLRGAPQTAPTYRLPLSSPRDVCACCSHFSEFTRVRLLQRGAVQRRGGDSMRVRVDLKTQHVTRCRSQHQQCKLISQHMREQAAAAVTASAAPAAAPPRPPRLLQTELPAGAGAGWRRRCQGEATCDGQT